MKRVQIILAVAFLTIAANAADRYEAENYIVDINMVQKVADTTASGGYYVNMKEGALAFAVTAASTGFYTLWVSYSQPFDTNGKIQNLAVNGVSKGQVSFPYTTKFVYMKASAKIKLTAGIDTIGITHSWGWVNIDYIELTPYVSTTFSISPTLVSPNPAPGTQKIYSFLRENFQKKCISGDMTNTVFLNDGKYTPDTLEDQTEFAWILNASGKIPALIGLDFMHSTGKNSDGEWYKGYTNATLSLAQTMFKRGGIPQYNWHWKDPSQTIEAFYSPSSGNSSFTAFNLNRAFKDSTTYAAFDTTSAEYKYIIKDLDVIAGYLKTLADKGVSVLWRPLHEASGKWFWWGYKGPGACKALYRLMFDRFTNYHKLNNLIWVWVSDEAGDALNWYPGDAYVDIIGRDYYYYPREANHGSLVASFEKLKDIFGGKKIISLAECGSVPFPDSMVSDGAGWSYFMPWYGDYTMDGWAHDNTAADWKSIMNNSYVLTLDKMPGWDKYIPSAVRQVPEPRTEQRPVIRTAHGYLEVDASGSHFNAVKLFDLHGAIVATLHTTASAQGVFRFALTGISRGIYLARIDGGQGEMRGVERVVVR